MTLVMNVADLVNPESGKTYREENLKKGHTILLDSLVEVMEYDGEKYVRNPESLRLYVVMHGRDCDGTPLYWLSHQTLEEYTNHKSLMSAAIVIFDHSPNVHWKGEFFGPPASGGWPEEVLHVVRGPLPL